MPQEKIAIVTLCVGQRYLELWRKYCARNWQAYAARHGYALEILEAPLDPSPRGMARSMSWQKCLILATPRAFKYDRVIWVDADIVVNPAAPPIHDGVPPEKIGAVISGDYIQDDMKGVLIERLRGTKAPPNRTLEAWAADQRSFYAAAGVACASSDIVQGGVLVLSQSHRALLAEAYAQEERPGVSAYEQFALSATILNRRLLHRLDSRFNLVFYERMVVHYPFLLNKSLVRYATIAQLALMSEYANSYFLHFAYDQSLMQYLDPSVFQIPAYHS